ncbi:MAG: glutaredoxin family protein [Candidatus Omnitrophica bacterium]|nr:glutaredoxin family protein [Candidatus Omnitrophota bacterium]
MSKVTVYSTKTCSYCVRLKQYLSDNKISYENIDITSDPAKVKEMVDKSGQMGVPVVDIDGAIVVGFDKPQISKLLGI